MIKIERGSAFEVASRIAGGDTPTPTTPTTTYSPSSRRQAGCIALSLTADPISGLFLPSQLLALRYIIDGFQDVYLFEWLQGNRQKELYNQGNLDHEVILLRGFAKQVEQLEMIIYRAERMIDNVDSAVRDREKFLLNSRYKNTIQPPNFLPLIDSLLVDLKYESNLLLKTQFELCLKKSFQQLLAYFRNFYINAPLPNIERLVSRVLPARIQEHRRQAFLNLKIEENTPVVSSLSRSSYSQADLSRSSHASYLRYSNLLDFYLVTPTLAERSLRFLAERPNSCSRPLI